MKRISILFLILALAAPAWAIKYKGDLETNESITFPEQSVKPTNPASSKHKLYFKDGGVAYSLDSSGNENPVDVGGFKNKLINGNFDLWQRGTSFTFNGPGVGGYFADHWRAWEVGGTGGSVTITRQSFALGQSDVPGEPENFMRWATTTGTTNFRIFHRVEDVRTSAQRQWTFSFWAKAAAAVTMTTTGRSNPGSGGSGGGGWPGATGTHNLTTSWQKFSKTMNALDLTSSTLGAGNFWEVEFNIPSGNHTVDIARAQLEEGSVATKFEDRPIGLELALAQRYYQKTFPYATAPGQNAGVADALCYTALLAGVNPYGLNWYLKSPMRTDPTITYYNPSASNNKFRNTPDSGDSGTPVTDVLSPNYVFIRNPQVATDAVGEQICIHAAADAEI